MSYGRGHPRGTRRVSWKQQQWYRQIDEANIAHALAQQQASTTGTDTAATAPVPQQDPHLSSKKGRSSWQQV